MTEAAASPKKAVKAKKPKTTPNHPPTATMVNAAIKTLKERGGSSLQAIKKYIAANYKVDVEKLAPFIKKYLKSAVVKGVLVQTKGKGANGSFKLSAAKKAEKPAAKKPKAKKATKAKKPAKKEGAAKKKAAKPKAKSPKKEKKAKTPKKPKTPKPKKAVKKPAKKAAPKKK